MGFNLLHDEDFTIPSVTDTIQNSLAGHQLTTQSEKYLWIVYINGEEPITDQGVIDELNLNQN